MATVTLTEEQHGQLVHDYDVVTEAMENLRTELSSRTIDVDALKQDAAEAHENLQRIIRYLEDF